MGPSAATALSLDVPAIGLNAREGHGEAGGDAFFGLLAGHLASRNASDNAVAVISAKAAAGGTESVEPGAEAVESDDDIVTAPIPAEALMPGLAPPLDEATTNLAADTDADAIPPAASTATELAPLPALADDSAAAPLGLPGAPDQIAHLSEPSAVAQEPALVTTEPDTTPAESSAEAPAEAAVEQARALHIHLSEGLITAEAAPEQAQPPEGLELSPHGVEPSRDGIEAPPDTPPDEPSSGQVERVVRTVGNATQPTTEQTRTGPLAATTTADPADAEPTRTPTTATTSPALSAQALAANENAPVEAPAAAAAEAPRYIGPPEQVADIVIEKLEGNGGEARLVLDPPDLGEVVIRLHTRAGQVHLEIVVERLEALQLFRDGSPSLQQLLSQRGLELGDAAFFLSQHRSQDDLQQPGQQGAQPESGFAPLLGFDEPRDPATIQKFQRLRAAYNPDGALLYRV